MHLKGELRYHFACRFVYRLQTFLNRVTARFFNGVLHPYLLGVCCPSLDFCDGKAIHTRITCVHPGCIEIDKREARARHLQVGSSNIIGFGGHGAHSAGRSLPFETNQKAKQERSSWITMRALNDLVDANSNGVQPSIALAKLGQGCNSKPKMRKR